MRLHSEENIEAKTRTYVPFKAKVPPLRLYFRDFFNRIDFANQLASSGLRAQHTNTFAGQLWLVINPLLLALTYFFLVMVLSKGASRSSEYFAHLVAGIFMFYFISNSLVGGASSIVNVGTLISNKSFPRLLLPFSSVIVSSKRFLPTLIVYVCLHFVFDLPITLNHFLLIPVLVMFFMFALGAGAFFAALQVYFRDTLSILPYVMRIWLYITPVLYFSSQVSEKFSWIVRLNPLHDLFVLWGEILVRGVNPSVGIWIVAALWSTVALLAGLWFFLSHEREFAVRI